jgi:hypothetical protein
MRKAPRDYRDIHSMAMQTDTFSHDVPDHADGGRWMTHDELAAVRGIDRPSAVKLALRHGWPRRRDRGRVTQVRVPAEWAVRRRVEGGTGTGANTPLDTAPFETEQARRAAETQAKQSDHTRAVERSMWQERLAHERERAETAERERDRLQTMIDGLETRLAAAEARADTADEDRRTAEARADAAVSRALAAEGDRRAAEARAEDERARADVLDQSIAGARARGDALAEQVEAAEAALADERGRADAQRGRVDELKRLLASILRAQG